MNNLTRSKNPLTLSWWLAVTVWFGWSDDLFDDGSSSDDEEDD